VVFLACAVLVTTSSAHSNFDSKIFKQNAFRGGFGDGSDSSRIDSRQTNDESVTNSKKSRILPHRRAAPHVRAAIAALENETLFHPERSAHGGRGPSAPPIDYGGKHPYEVHQRRLEEGDGGTDSKFSPMRITLHIDQLMEDARNSNSTDAMIKAEFITEYILENMKEYWSQSLSVVPVKGSLTMDTYGLYAGVYCGDTQFTRVPSDHITQGIPDTDLVLYVSASDSPLFCGGSTLAVAVACNMDQYDRPTAGAINFCLDGITDISAGKMPPQSVIDDSVDVAIHEAGHVLGMSSNSFRFFRNKQTGMPLTLRPIEPHEAICVDGQARTVYLPSSDVLQFKTDEVTQKRSAVIVTETVRTVARNQFDCQDLLGAQLENQPTGSSSCTGDHWDERLFYPEALSGIVAPTNNILSPLTLALLEDSGWYKANYSMTSMDPWGLGAGCDFVHGKCIEDGNVPSHSRGYFCADKSQYGCSFGNTHKMSCTLLDYSKHGRPIPENYQYFPNSPSLGGPTQADYCPIFSTTYAVSLLEKTTPDDLDCRNTENNNMLTSISNVYWEEYGPDSRCFETDLGYGICYNRQCIKDENVVKVFIRDSWHTCEYDFQEIQPYDSTLGLLDFIFTCPRLSSVCPDLFCPANCSGRGTCVYEKDEENPDAHISASCKCFDETDTSVGCSTSLILKGDWIENSEDLKDKIRDGRFFDPLIKIFLDDPQNWTKDSWVWAIGLMIIVGVLFLCFCSSFFQENKKMKKRHYSDRGKRKKRHAHSPRRQQRLNIPHSPQRPNYYHQSKTPQPSAPPLAGTHVPYPRAQRDQFPRGGFSPRTMTISNKNDYGIEVSPRHKH